MDFSQLDVEVRRNRGVQADAYYHRPDKVREILEDGLRRHPQQEVEGGLGRETDAAFFFVRGLLRENYDLVYPYLRRDGARPPKSRIPSRDVYNFDLLVKSRVQATGRASPAMEVFSGGMRMGVPSSLTHSAGGSASRGLSGPCFAAHGSSTSRT